MGTAWRYSLAVTEQIGKAVLMIPSGMGAAL